MTNKTKSPSAFDRVRQRLRDVLAQLGPLLRLGKLQPRSVPVRVRRGARQ